MMTSCNTHSHYSVPPPPLPALPCLVATRPEPRGGALPIVFPILWGPRHALARGSWPPGAPGAAQVRPKLCWCGVEYCSVKVAGRARRRVEGIERVTEVCSANAGTACNVSNLANAQGGTQAWGQRSRAKPHTRSALCPNPNGLQNPQNQNPCR